MEASGNGNVNEDLKGREVDEVAAGGCSILGKDVSIFSGAALQPEPTAVSSAGSSAQPTDDDQHCLSCLVCGDHGTGFHYKAFSCEACKGFFKRTVQKSLTYTCKGSASSGESCVVNKANRNNCQFCRFQKCLSVGMRTDVVRPDRRPGGQRKTKELHEETQCPEKPSATSSWRQPRRDAEQPEVDTSSKGVLYYQSLDADEAEPWELAIRELIQSRPESIPQVGKAGIAGAEEDFLLGPSTERAGIPVTSTRGLSQHEVIQVGYNELLMIIEWAKGIGRFRSLLLEDQMCLLKSSFMDLQVMRVAYRSIDTYPLIRYSDKNTLTEAESKELGWGEACEETIRFCCTLVELKLDLLEFSILQALVLCFPDATGLKEIDRVRALQKFYLECLHKHEQCAFPGDNTRYGKLLMRLPSLRRVSARSLEQFLRLKLEGKIDVYGLVKEMMNFSI
ncbi:retinoic acid receptor RXR-alpha-B-like [Diadema antillarum]|uniref:retinoic acid receptor RXR-alpha-B-like n=1 Tax=Diadema antillarum TaxID=105358 RepID=UPI003A8B46FE